jgi:hypothetical protein
MNSSHIQYRTNGFVPQRKETREPRSLTMKAPITFKDEENVVKKYFEELQKPMSDRTNDESGNRYFYSL